MFSYHAQMKSQFTNLHPATLLSRMLLQWMGHDKLFGLQYYGALNIHMDGGLKPFIVAWNS